MTKRTRPKDRREQLLAAATKRIVAEGYQQTSVSSVASDVGITAGALYRHFANKGDLLEAVFLRSFDIAAPTVSSDAGLEATLQEHCRLYVDNPDAALLWAREARHLAPLAWSELRSKLKATNRAYADLVLAERAELDDRQARLLAWGIQAVIASPGRFTVRVTARKHRQLLVSACLAIAYSEAPALSSPPPALPGVVAAASTRERLLAAGAEAFSEFGYADASLQQIGERAGVTGPSLYSHYENKMALLRAGLDRWTNALWFGLHVALNGSSDAEDALERVIHSYVRAALTRPNLMSLLVDEPHILIAQDFADRQEYFGEWRALLKATRPNIGDEAAAVVVHASASVIHDLTREPYLVPDENIENALTSMTLAVLRANLGH